MTQNEVRWPSKTRELRSNRFDSTIWNDFRFRDDDIVIATYAKSGTTWMQQIIAQLSFDGTAGLEVAEMLPWLDLRVPPPRTSSCPLSRRRSTAASSRHTCRSMPWCSRPRARYQAKALAELGAECDRWLETGSR